jgi:uncharacterized protein YaiI (UPF0178 family)
MSDQSTASDIPADDGPADDGKSRLFIDADACPVKDEAYKVAVRYGLKVLVVSNSFIMTPRGDWIEQVVVDSGPDVADDWIVEQARARDIVITNDIPLASRCLEKGALAIGATGRVFTPDSIGMALAQRGLAEHLRSTGEITKGPAPFGPNDRSRFLSALDEAVNRAKRMPRR